MTIENRYDFVMIFDVENGNPNGDPDAGNAPRVDAETGYGYVTDVCLKRKIRNYVELCKEGKEGYNILVKPDRALNSKFTEAYEKQSLETGRKEKNVDDVKKACEYMCRNYYDVRTFGAVMSTGDDPCGIVRGPVQLTFGRSVSPIFVEDVTITRQARTTEERAETGNTEMGKKSIIPYALYRAEGYISAALAQKTTQLSEEDVEVLWDAIINMFESITVLQEARCACVNFTFLNTTVCWAMRHPIYSLIKLILNKKVKSRRGRSETMKSALIVRCRKAWN